VKTSSKDSSEVVKFMSLLAKLKDWSDDDPASLPDLAKTDEGVKALCRQLYWAASFLKRNERRHRELFAAPVDPKFVTAWRDFENRFEGVLPGIALGDLSSTLGAAEPKQTSEADLQWENADDDAAEQARAINGAIDFACDQATQDGRKFPEGLRESIEDGEAAWTGLKRDAGFDLRGVFRRRELVPFVLVPRHVHAKHGSAEALRNLQQAHDAFVFGAPLAGLALMRSTMEALLRDHYRAEGRNLSERIDDADKRLPSGASAAALHRLRKLANAILHLDADKDERLSKIEPNQLEKEIVSLLFVLRALIEAAPSWLRERAHSPDQASSPARNREST
jgi:hypothetical protein